MARIEKTIFISYRRTDVYTALAVYENLKNQGYDVFFDYRSISSGDFEQIITSNIRARAHFILILTPTALDRCNEPGDWLRREIELAIDEKRNIVPLFFKGFRFGSTSKPGVSKWVGYKKTDVMTGKLKDLSRYNGLNVHEDYFDEAMQRLQEQFLNKPLDTILHPVSTEVQKVVKEEQVAADEALKNRKVFKKKINWLRAFRPVSISTLLILCIWGGISLWNNLLSSIPEPTRISLPTEPLTLGPVNTNTPSPTKTLIPPTPTLGIGSTLTGKDGMTLLYVPAGEFTMGSDKFDDTKPVLDIYLDSFWIDQTEVTNKQYTMCVSDGVCALPLSLVSPRRSNGYYEDTRYEDYPVIFVNWFMANNYCEWAGRRLPNEAEWEKAARGADGNVYPWGNDLPNGNLLNYKNYWNDTSVVKQYSSGKSLYGAYDMAGNVWEWTSSLYMPYPFDATDGREDDSASRARVLRGGSWYFDDGNFVSIFRYGVVSAEILVRSDLRSWADPEISNGPISPYGAGTVGFRCAMDAP